MLFSKIIAVRKKTNFIKKNDFWTVVLFLDPIAIPIVKKLKKTKITPNQITVAGILLSLVAMIAFSIGQRSWEIFGGIFFYLGYMMDCLDGKLARLKKMQSDFGKKLDAICDHSIKTIIFASIIYGQFILHQREQAIILGLVLFFLHYSLHLIHKVLIKKVRYKQYVGCRELLVFRIEQGKKMIKKYCVPSIYSYADEKFFLFIVAPILGIFKEFLIISLFLSLFLKIVPEVILLLSKKQLKKVQSVKSSTY